MLNLGQKSGRTFYLINGISIVISQPIFEFFTDLSYTYDNWPCFRFLFRQVDYFTIILAKQNQACFKVIDGPNGLRSLNLSLAGHNAILFNTSGVDGSIELVSIVK